MLSNAIYYTSIVSPLLALWYGKSTKVLLWWYAMTALLFDIVGVTGKYTGIKVPGWGNIFMLIELYFIATYYIRILEKRSIINTVCILLVAFFIIHILYIRPFDTTKPLTHYRVDLTAGALFYLLYIILAMAGFYKMLTGPLLDNILLSRFFWVNVTFLIYASGVFFMFMFAERIRTQDIALGAKLWSTVFCGLNITKNILLAKALSIKDGIVKP